MNFFKTTIFAISAIALSLGFASCSDDDNDTKPTVLTKTEWTVKEVKSDITVSEEEAENTELIEAIDAKVKESASILKSLTLFSDGKYETTVQGGTESGVYKMTTDSLFLTVKSPYNKAENVAKNRAYAVKKIDETNAEFTENLTNEFAEEFPALENVNVTYSAEGVNSVVAEPY